MRHYYTRDLDMEYGREVETELAKENEQVCQDGWYILPQPPCLYDKK